MNRKKNVLFIFGLTHRPDLPNFSQRFLTLSDYFNGSIIATISNDKYERYKIGNFDFYGTQRGASGLVGRLVFMFSILKLALTLNKQNKIDVIYCYEPQTIGPVGALLKRLVGAKMIVGISTDASSSYIEMSASNKLLLLIKKLYHNFTNFISFSSADVITIMSPDYVPSLPQRYVKKYRLLPSYVPDSFFINENNPFQNNVLFIGSPFYLKGVDVLIRAFESIADDFPDFKLKLVGYLLKDEATKHFDGFHPNIEFVPPSSYDKLKNHLLECYCLVLPSRSEGFGRVLLEAMACGKPVVGSRIGGIPQGIDDGENGYLFESENSEELAQKLRLLLSDREKALAFGERSRGLIREKFSSEIYCKTFSEYVEEL